MSSSYNRNIERMRSRERSNVQQANTQRTNMANIMGQRGINEAQDLNKQLSAFSSTLMEMRKENIAKQKEEGAIKAQEQAEINAEKLVQLQDELGTLTDTDTRYHEIKAEMLKVSGPDIYPDADRIANLSPWQQAGFMKEKLRMFNDTFADKLNHAMMTSEKALKIENLTFTPKELHDNNIHGLPFKEAAIQMVAKDIKKNAGLHKFSPELLELAGTNAAIQKAKESATAKYRQRYNIESSSNTRNIAQRTWQQSNKTGEDIHHYLVKTAATVDGQNQMVGNAGAWKALEGLITQEGINQNDPEYAAEVLNQPMPDRLALQLGAKKGTTYSEHWPGKVATLKQAIRDGYTKQIDNELKNLESAGTTLKTEFIEEARKGNLSTQRVNEYKREFGSMGLPIPSSVTNYETVTMRDQREDTQEIKALMASQNGYISNAQLDQFHPQAAVEFRDKASKLEKSSIAQFDGDKQISAALNTVFEGMGLKGNEKTLEYEVALANAKEDYIQKFNNYVAMGYSQREASYYALNAESVKDKETGEDIPNSEGVIYHIKKSDQENRRPQYVSEDFLIKGEQNQGKIRVAEIAKGKRQLMNDSNIIFEKPIGGTYGKKQLDTIITNINKYGHSKGVLKDKGAVRYYQGLARGRNINWMGLVDAQLKTVGHDGLWPDERPQLYNLYEGKDEKGKTIADPQKFQPIIKAVERAQQNPTKQNVIYAYQLLRDTFPDSQIPSSVWDDPEEVLPFLQ
tara:strand:- start:2935 stop:5157 length:2223 start_codon:yes stop_codon:yes gene_type:complete